MGKCCFLILLLTFCLNVRASWYWPFGSDDGYVEKDPPRISELIEPASVLIDEAADCAAEGKVDEAVEKYRKALDELNRIEMENPERAKGSEFATVRNKRAYVNAAIDSMLLSQVKSNAKAVAVSDTTALEKKLAEEKKSKTKKADAPETVQPPKKEKTPKPVKRAQAPKKAVQKPLTKREQAMQDIISGDFAAAELIINEMLIEKPNGAMPLNLKAIMEIRQGKFKEAERTLDQAIMSNPRNHFAYYNMARLIVRTNPGGKSAARRYYETGRAMGGPEDAQLEAAFK